MPASANAPPSASVAALPPAASNEHLGLEFLSHVLGRLGRSRHARRFLRTLRWRLRWLKCAWLRRAVLRHELVRPDDVTVLIGIRNRADHRIANALRSIREQKYPAHLIQIAVIDYGSEPTSAQLTKDVCQRHGAEYVRIDDAPIWSRSRCLNVGIRRATTKFLMTSDADVVLSPRYLSGALHVLTTSHLSVICSPMLDLPEDSTATFRRMAETGEDLQAETWKQSCSPRLGWDFHPSVAVSYTAFFQLIRGYDEYYELWGSEDDDLLRRLQYLGLQVQTLDAESFYLHQWHPKFEGVPGGKHAKQIQQNRLHLEISHSILRNDRSWGLR